MKDVIDFFSAAVYRFHQDTDYYNRELEAIAAENGKFAYVDNRKEYTAPLIEGLKRQFDSDNRYALLKDMVLTRKPDHQGKLIKLFSPDLPRMNWDKFINYINCLDVSAQRELFDHASDAILKLLTCYPKDHDHLTNLLGVKIKSNSQVFPDFMFTSCYDSNNFRDGTVLELKDAEGTSIASFNSTIPTRQKALTEIERANNNDLVTRLASFLDFPHSQESLYTTYHRACFYFVRTNKKRADAKMSLVEGSFFETMPKRYLIAETMKAIAREHLGTLTSEQEAWFDQIYDQHIVASSRSDLTTKINDREKRASVSPRFRIMCEVTTDGNPHTYPEIPAQTFNLITRVAPGQERDEIYRENREARIKSVCKSLSARFQTVFDYDEQRDIIADENLVLQVREIEHRRNGIHLVFQYSLN